MSSRMKAPKSGVKIRMYRQGHGDCFLLCMPDDDGNPYYLLIDCGFKPGSQIHAPVADIIADIKEATGGHLHAVLVTHEHEDHVNIFMAERDGKRLFDEIEIGELLLGWTADPSDKKAKLLRKQKQKAVALLLAARRRLAAIAGARAHGMGAQAGSPGQVEETLSFVDAMLAFEGADADLLKELGAREFGFAAADAATISSKFVVSKAMDYLTKRVKKPRYFSPHEDPFGLPGVGGVRLFSLGPPRGDPLDVDEPKKSDKAGQARMYEKTKHSHGLSLATTNGLEGLFAAADSKFLGLAGEDHDPFSAQLQLRRGEPGWDQAIADFFDHFAPAAENWQAIDHEWLLAAAWFANKINTEINNSSLVIAIELKNTRKVLLFAGDAQYGSWMSWADKPFKIGSDANHKTVTTRELMARTVFYKVGHHGSHNATLKGTSESDHPNLDWMGLDDAASQFVAVIPANTEWARTGPPTPWEHPLKAIYDALLAKTDGRLFKSDVDFSAKAPKGVSKADWKKFAAQVEAGKLFFEYTIADK
jgi:hypothetical protein